MRLLKHEDKTRNRFGGVSSYFSQTTFSRHNIPKYAVLSHRWGSLNEEVTFKDLENGSGKSKVGYKKLTFCAEQVLHDGLEFFWIDACCIDKSSSAELSEAINSMFKWYQNATKCYVYLSDVSTHDNDGNQSDPNKIESAFRESKWFTRGWTLQELIAPASVEFYSAEGVLLGNKKSLEWRIHEITGISLQALRGSPLSQFDFFERMSWAKYRETTLEEDAAYSLLGIFDVHIPPIYGEGRRKALIRLQREFQESLKHNSLMMEDSVYNASPSVPVELPVSHDPKSVEIIREQAQDPEKPSPSIVTGQSGMKKFGLKLKSITTRSSKNSMTRRSAGGKNLNENLNFKDPHEYLQRKLVIVGDGGTGKSSLVIVFTKGTFSEVYVPTVFENYVTDVELDGHSLELALWDTTGLDDYDKLRPLSYADSHIAVICFAINNPDSLVNIDKKWIREIRRFCPGISVILVGTKKDLRYDYETFEELKIAGQRTVTTEEGENLCRKIGAVKYIECSAKTGEGVREAFEWATRSAVTASPTKKRRWLR